MNILSLQSNNIIKISRDDTRMTYNNTNVKVYFASIEPLILDVYIISIDKKKGFKILYVFKKTY